MGAEKFDPDEIIPPSDDAPKVEWAIFCSLIGLRVHPLHHVANGKCSCGDQSEGHRRNAGKHPRIVGWQKAATRDEAQIRRWWDGQPLSNVGLATGEGSGVIVLDADGVTGRASLAGLNLPETFTIETGGRGGLHAYFEHPELGGVFVGNKTSKLAPKLDIRTERGNLVGPGSVSVGGKYRVANFAKIAPLPKHIVDRMLELLNEPAEPRRLPTSLQLVHDETIPLDVREKRARAYARTIDPAISGSGGHTSTFEAAARIVRGFELPDHAAYRILADEYNPRCKPPWSQRELERKVREAVEKSRFEWGYLLRDRQDWKGEAKSETRLAVSEESSCTAEVIPATPTPAERVRALITMGPVTRLATGIPTLDRACRGGLPTRRLVVLGGAPGAGKTTLATFLGWRWAKHGIPVSFLSVDEGPEGVLMRIAQMEGLRPDLLEERDPTTLERLACAVEKTPLSLVDDGDFDGSVEGVASILAKQESTGPKVLIVDSIQTIRSLGSDDADSPRERVDAVVKALKRARDQYGFLILATCELARGAYRSKAAAENINDLASFKESGGIEYAAQTALVLRSVPDEHSLVDVTVPKNRAYKREPFRLRLDSATTTFTEVEDPNWETEPSEGGQASKRMNKAREHAEVVRKILLESRGLGKRELYAASEASHGLSSRDVDVALAVLGDLVHQHDAPGRKILLSIRNGTGR